MKAVRIALVSASAWSALLVVAALTVPVYAGESGSADVTGEVSSGPTAATLVEVNGAWGLVVASIPLLACAVVGALLLGPGSRTRPASRTRQVIAAVVVGLLGILTVLSLLTVGVFVAPATAGLAVAVLLALASPTERLGAGPA